MDKLKYVIALLLGGNETEPPFSKEYLTPEESNYGPNLIFLVQTASGPISEYTCVARNRDQALGLYQGLLTAELTELKDYSDVDLLDAEIGITDANIVPGFAYCEPKVLCVEYYK